METGAKGPEALARAIEAVYGFAKTQALVAARRAGVLDALAPGPLGVTDLAARTGLDPDPLERVLIALAASGLTELREETWSLTAAGSLLAPGGPLALNLPRIEERMIPSFARLPEAVAENRPLGLEVMGLSSPDEFYTSMDDDAYTQFLTGLHGVLARVAPAVLGRVDLSGCSTLLDVGGGSGGFSIEAVRRHPDLQAIVYDLERPTRLCRRFAEDAGMAGRVEYRAGDLFGPAPLPAADVVSMSLMLRWMSDEQQALALRKALEALPPGGRLLVIEMFLNDDMSGPLLPAVMCLSAFLLGEGRDRSAGQWRELVEGAGFTNVEVHRLGPAVPRDVLVARRP